MKEKLQKGLSKLGRVITTPNPSRIRRVNFAVTYRCNSRCNMCSIWEKYQKDSSAAQQEMTLGQIEEFFSNMEVFKNLDEINLTGGEPFLRPDFVEIYRFLRCTHPRTMLVISTNGLRLSPRPFLESSEDVSWTVLVFSLDGLKETNDKMRGIKGSYDRVLEAVDYYKENHPALKTALSFTVMLENYKDIRGVFDLSQRLGLAFTFRFAAESETYYGCEQEEGQQKGGGRESLWSEGMLDEVQGDVKYVIDNIAHSRGLLNRVLNPDLYFFSRMVEYQRDRERMFKCHSGTHSLFLDPYGKVYPCIFSAEPLGNVTKQRFSEIWFSDKAGGKRLFIAQDGCHCWTECETMPSLQRGLGHVLDFITNPASK